MPLKLRVVFFDEFHMVETLEGGVFSLDLNRVPVQLVGWLSDELLHVYETLFPWGIMVPRNGHESDRRVGRSFGCDSVGCSV